MKHAKTVTGLAALALLVLTATGCAATGDVQAGNTRIAGISAFAQYDAAATTVPATRACSQPGGMQGGSAYRR
jgi:hypothetical protein